MKLQKILALSCTAMMSFSILAPAASAQTVPMEPSVISSAPERATINDTFQKQQWYLEDINAYEAWAIATSGPRHIVVAVIDGGMDDTHPDLKGALWSDPDELPNGKDDDGDGLIDDIHGWNYISNNSSTRPIERFAVSGGAWEHGTIVSSLIAGRGNDDIGMAGMDWNVKIMPLVILGPDGAGSTEVLVKAIRYAVQHRADIINLSLEGDIMDDEVGVAILEATSKGVLVVIAAGNSNVNFDEEPLYPACHEGAAGQSLLVVGALNQDDERYLSSNYGYCVNIAAPGDKIFAARPTYDNRGNRDNVSGYGSWSGTSLAAPLVTGVASMLKAKHPYWTAEQIAQRIKDTAAPLDSKLDTVGLGAGKLNAYAALSDAPAMIYGPWNLFVSPAGRPPTAYITDEQGNDLFTIAIGNAGDKRQYHAAFVRWDKDRIPEVIVTTENDPKGEWRVYRTDGILIAAGQVTDKSTGNIAGGLLVSTQDIDNSGYDHVLLSESLGSRVWLFHPELPVAEPAAIVDESPLGIQAVGLERPHQSFVLLGRSKTGSQLSLLSVWGLDQGTFVTTTKPENLKMTNAQTKDGRELLRFVQSGDPSYIMERNGALAITEEAEVWRYIQAPLGEVLNGNKDRLFHDTWPR
ncbi:MAG: S8 family peptidase [Patescibacteria group bacterium]